MESKIVKAIVYKDRAQVTRQMTLDLRNNQEPLIFKNLPPIIDRDSIRIKAMGKGQVRINGINLKEEFLEKASSQEIQGIKKQQIEVNDQIALLERKKSRLLSQEAFIVSLKTKAADEMAIDFNYKKASAADIEKTIQKTLEETLFLVEERQKLEIELLNFCEKKNALEARLRDIQTGEHLSILNALIDYEVLQEGEVRFFLSYLVPNCFWNPYYDARLIFEKQEMEVTFYGDVRQISGENWEDIELYFSTANPSLPADIPELDSWHIGVGQEYAGGGFLSPEEFSYAQPETSGVYLTFRIPKKETLLSHETGKKIPVDFQVFPAEITYVSIPKESENVFIQAVAENKGSYPFLEGALSVFYNSDYIGESILPSTVMNQKMKVFLGIDESIKIKKEKLKEFRENKGITGGQNKITYSYQMEIQNFKEKEIQVIILENIPVSKNSEIKVRIEKAVPESSEPDEKGILKWDLSLKPKEKKVIDLEYSVEYPKEKTLTGI